MPEIPDRKNDVVVVGSTNWDICMYLPRLPKPGETVGDGRLETNIGGKGANQAMASHNAGANTCFISCVGDDSTGTDIKSQLSDSGLNTSTIITTPNCSTGTACIYIDDRGENCIGLTSGANAMLSTDIVLSHQQTISDAAVVLMQLEIPMDSVLTAARCASETNTCVILNPAPANQLDPELFSYVDLLTPNRSELAVLTGSAVDTNDDILAASRSLMASGVGTVLVTLGSQGAVVVTDEGHEYFAPYAVAAEDTTAAGDCFNGYLAAAIAESGASELSSAIKKAMAAAAISVTRKGAIPSIPSKEEVDAFMQSTLPIEGKTF